MGNLLNVGFDVVFVFGFGLFVVGVVLVSVIVEYIMVIMVLVVVFKCVGGVVVSVLWFNCVVWKVLMKFNGDMLLCNLVL